MLLRRALFILLALAISGGTVVAARGWMNAKLAARPVAEAAAAVPSTTNVLVAKSALPAGSFVRPESLKWQPWPKAGVAASYIVEGKGKLEDYVGAVVRQGVMAGEPIVDGRVVRPGDRGFMAAVLTPGMRAVTVPVTPSSGVAGFIFPGDHVDVLLTLVVPQPAKSGRKMERRASDTVLSNVRVLAVDQRANDQEKKPEVAKLATLEVTPKQAEILAVAGELGKLSLSLRSLAQVADGRDDKRTHTWDSEATHLLQPPQSALRKVSVVRGSKAADVQFARSR